VICIAAHACGLGCTRAIRKVKARPRSFVPAWAGVENPTSMKPGMALLASSETSLSMSPNNGCTAMYNGPSQFIGDDKDPAEL